VRVAESKKLTLRCPDCQTHLVVDSATGEVLFHKKAKGASGADRDFDVLLEELKAEKLQAEEIFEREVEAHKDRDRLLEERFDEALRQAESDPDDRPPPRPFDLE
jgi:CHAD domain-containing protein